MLADAKNIRHPNADVARLCIVNALRQFERLGVIHPDSYSPWSSVSRYLRQALAALAPPPEPPSYTFWLGGADDAA